MRKNLFKLIVIFTLILTSTTFANTQKESDSKHLYAQMSLTSKISFEVFENAMEGYEKIGNKKKNLLTIIDYSKPSTEERMFVLDLDKRKVLHETIVAHGKGTGGLFAKQFSNISESHKSSMGFFLTEETYTGRNGYSLRIDGLEPGINDNAKKRAIVIHGANYANPSFIQKYGRLGRSYGCPAVPLKVTASIINTIKNGTVLFINGNDSNYFQKSKYL